MKIGAVTEKTFQAQVIEFARLCGFLVYHHTHRSRRSAPASRTS